MGKRGPKPNPQAVKDGLKRNNRIYLGEGYRHFNGLRNMDSRARGIQAIFKDGEWHVEVYVGKKVKLTAADPDLVEALRIIGGKWQRRREAAERWIHRVEQNLADILGRTAESHKQQQCSGRKVNRPLRPIPA